MRRCGWPALSAVLAVVILQVRGEPTNRPVVTDLSSDGTLRWEDATTNGAYRVEWTPSLHEEWRTSWDSLKTIPANADGEHVARVPMFYRVVRIESEGAADNQSVRLTLDAANPRDTLSTTHRRPTLWATLDGTVYRLEIQHQGPLYMGVGQSRELTASVTPSVPGTYQWGCSGGKATLENASSQTVTIVAGPEPSEEMGDQTITVSFRPDLTIQSSASATPHK